jgi:hypothetical protein
MKNLTEKVSFLRYGILVLPLLLVGLIPATAQIIPPDRQVDWTQAGIPGGIPNRTNIWVNVLTTTNSVLKCAADGVTDDSQAIYTALYYCPSNMVVYMPAGNYCFSHRVYLASYNGVTLRGDGIGKTVILDNVVGGSLFSLGSGVGYGNGFSHYLGTNSVFGLLSGYTKGSSNLMVAGLSNPGMTLTVGQLVQVSESNDWFVTSLGANGQNYFSGITSDGQHCLDQMAQITAISGNNITIWPPLGFTYSNALNPVLYVQEFAAQGVKNVCRQDGFEGFTITNSLGAASQKHVFDIYCAVQCWWSNVEIVNCKNYAGFFDDCLQCQIDGCWIHATSTNYIYYQNYGLETEFATFCLFQNNIFDGFFEALQIDSGGCGNVVFANFFTNYCNVQALGGADAGRLQPCISVSHGAYPMMNLIEGNVGMAVQADFYWGSSGYDTILRNAFTSVDTQWVPSVPVNDIFALKIDAGSWWNNIVGNVLGSPSVTYSAHQMSGLQGYDHAVIARFGYPNIDSNGYNGTNSGTGSFDTNTLATMILTGNYDYYNNSIMWDTNGVQAIPNSLIYPNSAPSWWGTNRWPAVQPDASTLVTAIPAQLRSNGDPTSGNPIIPNGGGKTNAPAPNVAPPFNLHVPTQH